jgi:hypothetical protein
MSVLIGLRNEENEQYVIKMNPQLTRESIEANLSAVCSVRSCLSVQAILGKFLLLSPIQGELGGRFSLKQEMHSACSSYIAIKQGRRSEVSSFRKFSGHCGREFSFCNDLALRAPASPAMMWKLRRYIGEVRRPMGEFGIRLCSNAGPVRVRLNDSKVRVRTSCGKFLFSMDKPP